MHPSSWFLSSVSSTSQGTAGAVWSPTWAEPAQRTGDAWQRFSGVKQEQQWVFAGVSFQGMLQACC